MGHPFGSQCFELTCKKGRLHTGKNFIRNWFVFVNWAIDVGLSTYFSENNNVMSRFVTLPLETLDKRKLSPWKSCKILRDWRRLWSLPSFTWCIRSPGRPKGSFCLKLDFFKPPTPPVTFPFFWTCYYLIITIPLLSSLWILYKPRK